MEVWTQLSSGAWVEGLERKTETAEVGSREERSRSRIGDRNRGSGSWRQWRWERGRREVGEGYEIGGEAGGDGDSGGRSKGGVK